MIVKSQVKSKWFYLMSIVFLGLHSFFRITSPATAQGLPLPLYEVKTIITAELGMNKPSGMTFMPGEQSFLVWGDGDSVTMTIYGDLGNPVDIAVLLDNPLGAAFDPRSDSLFFLTAQGAELATIKREDIGLPTPARQTMTRFNIRAFDLEDIQGMTFDPQTGRLFILDARKQQILIISPHPTLGFDGEEALTTGGIHRINLASFLRAAPRGMAFNPNNGNLYIGSPTEKKIYELTGDGKVISVFDTSPFLLKNPSTMVFAPSSDQTDDLRTESLYVVDGDNVGTTQSGTSHMPRYGKLVSYQTVAEENDGRILELSLTEPLSLPPGTTLLPSTVVQVIDTSKAAWSPSSPDPSGIDYWPLTGRLLLADSEVDEMPNYFTGDNVFDSTLSGELISTCSTTNLSRSGFSNEPSGLAIDPTNNRIYFSDDNLNRIFEVSLGADGNYCTSDDVVTFVNVRDLYGISDTEDVAYGQNTIFIAGGTDAEVYKFNLGADGKLGGDDGPMTHFDTKIWGFNDLEGIGYNSDEGTLFIVSTTGSDNYVGHITTSGTLINAYDLSFMRNIPNIRSDVAFAPGSQNPAVKNIYIVSRGVDNDSNSNENDGKIWEIALGNLEPTATGADTVGVFRPSNGLLYLKNQNTSGFADIAINYGMGGDYPVVGDWDGDGDDTIGVYRGATFLLRNSNTLGFADVNVAFGQVGDQPIAGDWNGDGIDTIGIYRPSTGQFLLRNSNTAGPADMSYYLGNAGDVGIAGDWNGDSIDTTGVFRPGNGIIFLKNTNATGFADVALNYGAPGDKPVMGDWDNDGIDTIGIYRNARFYLRNSNTNGFADIVLDLGNPGDMPIAGNWDGLP